MFTLLVVALAVAGAMLALGERSWLTTRGIPPGRRLLYGALAGGAFGLLLLPALGLLAAVLVFAVSIALLIAAAVAVLLLLRAVSGRRG